MKIPCQTSHRLRLSSWLSRSGRLLGSLALVGGGLLSACAADSEQQVTPPGSVAGAASGLGGAGTASGGTVSGTGGTAGAAAMPASEVFKEDQVLSYHLTLTESDRTQIEEHGDLEQYVPATLKVTGGVVGSLELGKIGIRHKGAYSLHHCWELNGGVRNYAAECQKLSYKLSFNEYVTPTRFYGLKKLNLHASSGDATKLRELTAYATFRDFGIITSRAVPARVYINGTFVGLFFSVEDIDGRFTKFHYPEGGDGNLYKEIWPRTDALQQSFIDALSTNKTPPDVTDIQSFAAAVAAAKPATLAADLKRWVDVASLVRYLAVDRALKNWDGITAFYSPTSPHNFYWYHDNGKEDRFHLIPWDLDNTSPPFDPYMAPRDYITVPAIPNWNMTPANCDGRPVWSLDQGINITPPQCDPLLRMLAQSQWKTFVEVGNELLAGPFSEAKLLAQIDRWSPILESIIAEDPTMNVLSWRAEKEAFRGVLRQNIADYRAYLTEGLTTEKAEIPLAEPTNAELLASTTDGGLVPGQIYNLEFEPPPVGTAPTQLLHLAAPTATLTTLWNQSNPLHGTADLRMNFSFTSNPAAKWDEWVNLGLGTNENKEFDLRDYVQISLTLKADINRRVRVRVQSPAYNDAFKGIWSEFGQDFTVGTTPTTIKLRLDRLAYPSWARVVWTAGQGWTTTDAEALSVVLSRFAGLVFAPAATFTAAGDLAARTESGFLQIDNIYFQK